MTHTSYTTLWQQYKDTGQHQTYIIHNSMTAGHGHRTPSNIHHIQRYGRRTGTTEAITHSVQFNHSIEFYSRHVGRRSSGMSVKRPMSDGRSAAVPGRPQDISLCPVSSFKADGLLGQPCGVSPARHGWGRSRGRPATDAFRSDRVHREPDGGQNTLQYDIVTANATTVS